MAEERSKVALKHMLLLFFSPQRSPPVTAYRDTCTSAANTAINSKYAIERELKTNRTRNFFITLVLAES